MTVDSGRRDRQEVVFSDEKTLHLLVFYSCKKCIFLSFRTVDNSQQDRQELVF